MEHHLLSSVEKKIGLTEVYRTHSYEEEIKAMYKWKLLILAPQGPYERSRSIEPSRILPRKAKSPKHNFWKRSKEKKLTLNILLLEHQHNWNVF